ncbi:Eco57I restriction-modification methylase domain-containing protein [Streptococcus halichoeri]|uniref:Eco57I restriction-modification methylase domain-containing protein n=1 Tax=Streptococcus halichoeri TaxID=254785 RepID=UPI001358BCAC|nr:N-6 DNA methylase [Streptococcus halichoeri]
MNLKSEQTSQKLMGVYYTPNEIVDYMLRWCIDAEMSQNILEPSAGDGQFIKGLKEISSDSTITAVEIDHEESQKIPLTLNCHVKVYNQDFYDFYEENRTNKSFDLVIGNPPYIRYQFLTEKQREFQSDILKNNNLRPNKLINSWLAFSVASIEMLKPGGKFAFVLPTDLLQVSYAKQLREYFKSIFSELNIVTFENLVFDGIQQDILIVMGRKKEFIGQEIRLRTIHVQNLQDLNSNIEDFAFDEYTDFTSDKWSSLNLDKNYRRYYDVNLKELTEPITDYAKIEVGITTGNNKFFVVNDSVIREYSLSEFAKPLLGRSVQTFGITHTVDDLQKNISSNKNTWLLDFNNPILNAGAKKYINLGKKNRLNLGYKLQIRDKWYEVPSIWEPDAFLLRRIGQFPKLIKNKSEAVSTDTFHRLRLLEDSPYTIEEIIFLFYSSPSLLAIELEGRVFGGGALEILPGDMKNVRLPKIKKMQNSNRLFEELDNKFRENKPIQDIVKWVDQQIVENSETKIDFSLTYSAWRQKNSQRYRSNSSK